MKVVKAVLFAVVLSLFPLAFAHGSQSTKHGGTDTTEPTGPVSGLATLLSIQESSTGRIATLRINLVAHTDDTAVTVHEFDQDRKMVKGAALATLALAKGNARSFVVKVPVERNQESHLYYKVKGRAIDGSLSDLTLYARIPAQDTNPCEVVDDYIQCPGMTEVTP